MSQPRRGHTLIEMLVSMSLISVALTAVALTLHALYGVDRRFRDGMATEAGLDLLTLALRQDAHYARGAKLAADGSGRATALVLSLPAEQVITYTSDASRYRTRGNPCRAGVARSPITSTHRLPFGKSKKSGRPRTSPCDCCQRSERPEPATFAARLASSWP